MSKLDEIEEMAYSLVGIRAAVYGGDTAGLLERPDVKIARALLAMLPVVRAADAVRSELVIKPRPTDAEVTFALAVDTMRRALEER